MQKESGSCFPASVRLKIYREARDRFLADHRCLRAERELFISGGRACYGMCRAMCDAIEKVTDRMMSSFTPDNFPEYFSYKPKTGWKQDDQYWWTISIKNGGFKKRMTVLNRLADGLSKGE